MKVRFVIYFKHFVLQRFFLKIVLRFVSLNVRGLRVKRKALFLFFKGKKPHCGMLQESHFCSSQWGDRILFDQGMNRSAGTASSNQ